MNRILKIVVVIILLLYFIGNILPNLIGIPLAAFHSYKIHKEAEDLINSEYQPKVEASQFHFKNGIWIHQKDSLARIEIKDKHWIILYQGIDIDSTDFYNYKVTGDLLELMNTSDTLKYHILNYNDEILSLMYIPKGIINIYEPKK